MLGLPILSVYRALLSGTCCILPPVRDTGRQGTEHCHNQPAIHQPRLVNQRTISQPDNRTKRFTTSSINNQQASKRRVPKKLQHCTENKTQQNWYNLKRFVDEDWTACVDVGLALSQLQKMHGHLVGSGKLPLA